jgi:hypothetical protein
MKKIMPTSVAAFTMILFLALAVSVSANPINPSWLMIDNSGPARYDHKMAYDLQRATIVMFGGKDSLNQMNSETWEWNGYWTSYQAPGPEARIGHGLCYDTLHHVTILFGGRNQAGEYLNDMWSWNGTTWTQFQANGPSPRGFFAFEYDINRNRVILFGGTDGNAVFGETWAWNGAQWSLIYTDGPVARISTCMAIWNQPPLVLLFGGQTDFDGENLNDTWELTDTGWSANISHFTPTQRIGHSMSYNPYFNKVTIFSGLNSAGPDTTLDDYWMWSSPSAGWNLSYGDNQPSGRSFAEMDARYPARDEDLGQAFLFGGKDGLRVFNELWIFPNNTANGFIPGDSNNDGVFNGLDIVYSINYLKGFGPPPPLRRFDCLPNPAGLYAAADANASCSFNGLDITYCVNYFKGFGQTPMLCPGCP